MIADADATLETLLKAEIEKKGKWNDLRITFDPPDHAGKEESGVGRGAVPCVNLYLYDVRENMAMRGDDAPLRLRREDQAVAAEMVEKEEKRKVGRYTALLRRRPPVRLSLSYLVTVYAPGRERDEGEHALLSEVLRAIYRNQEVDAPDPDDPTRPTTAYRQGKLQTNPAWPFVLSVAQHESGPLTDPARLWTVLGGNPRPAIGLLAVATFDPFKTRPVERAWEILVGIGQGTPPDGPHYPLEASDTRISFAGIVTRESEDGPPVPNARIHVEQAGISVPGGEATTDAEGFFSILNLPPGTYTAFVSALGYDLAKPETIKVPQFGRTQDIPVRSFTLHPVSTLAPDGAGAWDGPVRLLYGARTVSVTGRLGYKENSEPDSDNKPGKDKEKEEARPAPFVSIRLGGRRTITDAQGFFAFHGVSEGVTDALIAEAPGQGDVSLTLSNSAEKSERGGNPGDGSAIETGGKDEGVSSATLQPPPKIYPGNG